MNIDKNIDLPTELNFTHTALEIIEKLTPGDSVFFKKSDGEKVRRALFTTLFRKKIKDKKFITRYDRQYGGIRIWRSI